MIWHFSVVGASETEGLPVFLPNVIYFNGEWVRKAVTYAFFQVLPTVFMNILNHGI